MKSTKKMPSRMQVYLANKKTKNKKNLTKNIVQTQPQEIFYGQHNEDVYIKTLFPDDYKGCCIDVGAYDGVNMSNTYYFEKKGWRSLCIEPIVEEYDKCKNIRKECINCCAGKENVYKHNFTVFSIGGSTAAISSLSPDNKLVAQFEDIITSTDTRVVSVFTLSHLLEKYNFPINIDFISIDTEGTELDVLLGIDLVKYNVFLFIIENNFEENTCENYLKQFGYIKINRIAVNDFFIKKGNLPLKSN